MKINELIKENIEKYGAQSFFYSLNNSWYEWNDEVKEALLNEVYSHIKPEKIEIIEDVAKLLHNNVRGDELKHNLNIDLEELCKERKWVILFPYSDDNLEIRGFIRDELDCYDGGTFKFVRKGDFYEDLECLETENTYHKAMSDMCIYCNNDYDVKCEWLDNDDYIWCYEVLNDKLPRAYFDIQPDEDEDQIWARCCVIDLSQLYD